MKRMIPGILLIIFITVISFGCQAMTEEAGAKQGTTYYVATNGNDQNPGTQQKPFRTLKKSASMAKAGATIYMRGGTYKEAVIIATSTSTHFEVLKKAVLSKKAIFVEKPLTLKVKDGREICGIIEENNIFCQVGFMRRFDPAYAEAKRRIEAGDIGKPIYFRGISRDPVAPSAEYIKNSGGIFVDVSIHDFDIARFLMSSEVTNILAHGKVIKYPYVAEYNDVDQALSYIEFESGAAGDVEASRNAYYDYDIRAQVIGTEGTLLIGNNLSHHNINILTPSGYTHDIVPDFPDRFTDAYFLELKEFFKSIEEGSKSSVTARDGLKALEIATGGRESYKTGKTVILDSANPVNI
ncbi:Gfo/Idh/MocA family oxidoreductase [Bacillus pumilus]|uniref:Gfo/Idh/MocA family oxidoreductase n=1 Tax=Bacillus pumilus TaxID=1408 RepID=UPI002110F3E9|nr:Gfo/Idh/MocA family oxidoreductase [Bacillus pumilus]UUD42543.1 Gfo/Idh/MocA family oxidoreductase [Bacillus pumilus]